VGKNSIYNESTGTTIYANDVVSIPSYPDTRWVVKNGWHTVAGKQCRGWYLLSVKDKTILDLDEVGVDNLTKISTNVSPSERDNPVVAEEVEDTVNFYMELPDGTKLNAGDVVEISDYSNVQWIVKNDWYKLGTAQIHGWFFLSIADRTILPADQVDLAKVTKSTQSVVPEYRPPIKEDRQKIASPGDNPYIVIPDTDIRLYEGDVIKISNKPRIKWIVHMGWYIYQNVQNFGWYIESIKNGDILPISVIDLKLCTLVTVKTQGSELYDGKTINYTRPFTLADAEVLNRTFITVETIAQRDNLDKHKLVNGRIVRVNSVGGVVVYYAWNTETQVWDKVDFGGGGSGGGIPEIIGTQEHPIVLSELEEGLYRVIGVYKIAPHYDLKVTTPIHHLAFVRKDDGEEEDVQIKVIDEDEITDYIASYLGNVTFINAYATQQYLEDNYATIAYVDAEILALENMISEIVRELPEFIAEIADSRIDYLINPIPESFIRGLFPGS
jgi:hypothetical protein